MPALMPESESELEEAASLQRRVLWVLLAINATMFAIEGISAWAADSSGLLADSLDMLADASIYAIALYAVGRSLRLQANAASTSGFFQMALGFAVFLQVIRRYLHGSDPVSTLMILVGALALAANATCLILIASHREGGVHMRASWIFSQNDVIANIGVIVSGALVAVLGSRLPDLLIGAVISLVVIRGGIQILREAREARSLALSSWRLTTRWSRPDQLRRRLIQ